MQLFGNLICQIYRLRHQLLINQRKIRRLHCHPSELVIARVRRRGGGGICRLNGSFAYDVANRPIMTR